MKTRWKKLTKILEKLTWSMKCSILIIISMIEKKLPEEMRTDWVKCIAEDKKVDSEIVFIKLLKFHDK